MVRPVSHDELRDWLIVNGVDEMRGYGHICADDLADKIRATFIVKRSEAKTDADG